MGISLTQFTEFGGTFVKKGSALANWFRVVVVGVVLSVSIHFGFAGRALANICPPNQCCLANIVEVELDGGGFIIIIFASCGTIAIYDNGNDGGTVTVCNNSGFCGSVDF